jgi:hypothetical protein
MPPGTGDDGTNGNQPRGTQVAVSVLDQRPIPHCCDQQCHSHAVFACHILMPSSLVQVLFNTMHELGTNQKQSSPWFQAKSCQNHVEGNLMYNLPRAAIK